MHNRWAIILSAGFGGVAANLLKISLLLTTGPVAFPEAGYILTYSLGLVLMAGLGAFTAWALKETSVKKAFFIGIGLPAFLQVGAANLSQVNAPKPGDTTETRTSWLHLDFATPAFADSTSRRRAAAPSQPPKASKKLLLECANDKKPDAVVFYSGEKKMVQKWTDTRSDEKWQSVDIPQNAESFSVTYKGATSNVILLEPGVEKSSMTVTITQNPWTGIIQAVGYNKSSYEVEVSKK